jgi:chromosome segregation ATPase
MTSEFEALETTIEDLHTRYASAVKRKAEIGGELRAKKAELAGLVKEIQDAGYNPKTLKEDRDREMTELKRKVAEFEASLSEAEEGLRAFDNKGAP